MKILFFVANIFSCMSLFAASGGNSQDDKDLLSKFFVLSGQLGDSHFYDTKFVSSDKAKALCVLGQTDNQTLTQCFQNNLVSRLKEKLSFPFNDNASKEALNVIRGLYDYENSPDHVNLIAILLGLKRVQILQVEACHTGHNLAEYSYDCSQKYKFEPLPFSLLKNQEAFLNTEYFQQLDLNTVKAYAKQDNIKGFIGSVIKKNPDYKVGVAINLKAWKAYLSKSGSAESECLLQ